MSYPTTPAFKAINPSSNRQALFSQAVNGRTQSRKMGGHHWSFTAKYALLDRAEFGPVLAFVESQHGRHGVFTIVPPVLSNTAGTGTGSVTCSAASVGASSVTIAGLTGTLKASDYIKFSGHDKVYMLTADRDGAGAISISPALITAVIADSLIYANVPFTVRLANDVQAYGLNNNGLYHYEVDFVEALS
jgi:hypothetical protein